MEGEKSKKCKLLWCEARFQVKMISKKYVVALSADSQIKISTAPHTGTTFESLDMVLRGRQILHLAKSEQDVKIL